MGEITISDVIIIGYGPVGQLLALKLGQAGHHVTVVERWLELCPFPRAVHYDHEIARIFQGAGVMQDMEKISNTAEEVVFSGVGRQVLFSWRVDKLGQSAWNFANGFSQPDLEAVLDAAVRKLPNVEILRNWEAVSVTQDAQCAYAEIRSGGGQDGKWVPDGGTKSLSAKFIVGADGANTVVGKSMRTEFTDLGFAFDWLVVNVKWKPGFEKDYGVENVADPKRPTSIVPGGPGRRRWEFMMVPGDTHESLSRTDTAWSLLAPWNVTPENAILERHAIYTFRGRWADPWRDGRLLLAGDAAHLMPPFMGQGMCSGMRDAHTLAWQMDLVLKGRQPVALLDNYGSERLAHAQYMIHGSIANGKVMCIADADEAAARDERFRAAAADPSLAPPPPPPPRLGPGLTMDGNPHAGLLGFQGFVEYQGRTGRFDDVVGRGFTLIGTAFDPAVHLSPTNRQFLADLGAVVAQVTPDGPIRDVEGGYAGWFASQGYAAVLSRPDFYQFAAIDRAEELDGMVDALRAKLAVS